MIQGMPRILSNMPQRKTAFELSVVFSCMVFCLSKFVCLSVRLHVCVSIIRGLNVGEGMTPT